MVITRTVVPAQPPPPLHTRTHYKCIGWRVYEKCIRNFDTGRESNLFVSPKRALSSLGFT